MEALKILLVEDDQALPETSCCSARKASQPQPHAATRSEAVAVLGGNPVDQALMDIALPDGNGFTVYTEIKATREVPVIFLTASRDEASVVNGLNVDTASGVVTRHGKEVYLIALGCSDAAE